MEITVAGDFVVFVVNISKRDRCRFSSSLTNGFQLQVPETVKRPTGFLPFFLGAPFFWRSTMKRPEVVGDRERGGQKVTM